MKKLTLIALLTLTIDICFAQTFDVGNERLPGVSTLTIKSFNGCCAQKGFRAKYYFNDIGQAIRSEHFFKRQKRAEYEYQYDSLGSLIYKISTYDINNIGRIDTTGTYYNYDSKKRVVVKKIEWTAQDFLWTEVYSDFNAFNKPKTVLSYSSTSTDTSIKVLEYNQNGLLTKIQFLENDTLRTTEICDYNKQGALSYSLIPSIVGKENEPLAIWVGGSRHSPEERYEYTYDNQNRWTEKYVIYKDKKVLLEKRKLK